MLQISAFIAFVGVVVLASLMFLPATFIYGIPVAIVALAVVAFLVYLGAWGGRTGARGTKDPADESGQGVSRSPDNH